MCYLLSFVCININFIFLKQSSDAVEVCQFDLRNESLWKAMSEDAIRSVCMAGMIPVWPDLPPLCPSVVDPILVSNDLERELRVLVTSHRRVRCFKLFTWIIIV